MPELDGIRTLQEVRKIDRDISVIMLTGYGNLQTAQQSMEAGANQYLTKPPDAKALLAAVIQQSENTRERRYRSQLAASASQLDAALKKEIEQNEPHIWQARASVELVHDLNNPLTAVIGAANLLRVTLTDLPAREKELTRKLVPLVDLVEKAADYCFHLAENWRKATKTITDFEPINLRNVVEEVKQVIFSGNNAIVLHGLETPEVRGAKHELMRIFQNILKNGLEAGATEVNVSFERVASGLCVVVADNGAGMNNEKLRKALQGGFTSKVNGTGLGLNICRHLVAAHGGTLTVASVEHLGTTVSITFPVSGAGSDAQARV